MVDIIKSYKRIYNYQQKIPQKISPQCDLKFKTLWEMWSKE